ncbi:hypothetical protein, partial [Burkholderia pseudomallei]|uniref:hypothetical protein n=1 Tax=Burkholderia pseudomallei TaxID=28450 RepID=UPI001C4B7D0E
MSGRRADAFARFGARAAAHVNTAGVTLAAGWSSRTRSTSLMSRTSRRARRGGATAAGRAH